MKTWLIVNSGASGSAGDAAVEAVAQLSRRPEVVTRSEGSAEASAREAVAAGAELVIAAGGDGTVSAVVNGLAEGLDRVTLAVLPLGTANDFARTLGIPADPLAAAALIDLPDRRRIDLIHSHTTSDTGPRDRLIINASTGGFSERVHENLTPQIKQAWGPLAYLRAAINAAPEVCYHSVTIGLDDVQRRADACAVVIANGRSAGGFELSPRAQVDDGWLDVLVITAQGFLDEITLASQYLAGTHLESEHVLFHRGRVVRIDTDPPMQFSSDGELIGGTPSTFRVLPGALRVAAGGAGA
jgi:diacylglycerol kinase (ATP)